MRLKIEMKEKGVSDSGSRVSKHVNSNKLSTSRWIPAVVSAASEASVEVDMRRAVFT